MELVVKAYLYALKLVGLLAGAEKNIFTLTKVGATGFGGLDFDFRDRELAYEIRVCQQIGSLHSETSGSVTKAYRL